MTLQEIIDRLNLTVLTKKKNFNTIRAHLHTPSLFLELLKKNRSKCKIPKNMLKYILIEIQRKSIIEQSRRSYDKKKCPGGVHHAVVDHGPVVP